MLTDDALGERHPGERAKEASLSAREFLIDRRIDIGLKNN